jgi:hypothetical protein
MVILELPFSPDNPTVDYRLINHKRHYLLPPLVNRELHDVVAMKMVCDIYTASFLGIAGELDY